MSEKISRRILIVELIVFYIPLTLLFLVGTFNALYSTTLFFPWSLTWQKFNLIQIPFKVFFCIGLISVYFVSLRFLLEGTHGLFSLEGKWWFFSTSSLLLVIMSIITSLLPHPSGDTFKPEYVRSFFQVFKFGTPAFIPFAHVLLEKHLRKVTMEEYDSNN